MMRAALDDVTAKPAGISAASGTQDYSNATL
jgi:hypothetical protein